MIISISFSKKFTKFNENLKTIIFRYKMLGNCIRISKTRREYRILVQM